MKRAYSADNGEQPSLLETLTNDALLPMLESSILLLLCYVSKNLRARVQHLISGEMDILSYAAKINSPSLVEWALHYLHQKNMNYMTIIYFASHRNYRMIRTCLKTYSTNGKSLYNIKDSLNFPKIVVDQCIKMDKTGRWLRWLLKKKLIPMYFWFNFEEEDGSNGTNDVIKMCILHNNLKMFKWIIGKYYGHHVTSIYSLMSWMSALVVNDRLSFLQFIVDQLNTILKLHENSRLRALMMVELTEALFNAVLNARNHTIKWICEVSYPHIGIDPFWVMEYFQKSENVEILQWLDENPRYLNANNPDFINGLEEEESESVF